MHGKNVVIMVWKQDLNAGFGDLLRGTVCLHQLSKRFKFTLIVDTQLHPVSKVLVSIPHIYSNYVLENQSEIINTINSREKLEIALKNKLTCDKPFMITTNVEPHNDMTNDCKQFMRLLLHPTNEFKRFFIEMRARFNIPNNYTIAHFRVGDQDLIGNDSNEKTIDIANYQMLGEIVNFHMANTPNLFILSDSLEFKKYLCKRIRPEFVGRIIPSTPIHLSHPDAVMDIEKIKETMFDFMLLINARVIKTHSNYRWISNFVKWAGNIFSVPVLDMKPPKISMNLQVIRSTKIAPLIHPPANKPVITKPLFNGTNVSFRKMF
jgi:hypothetical protein